MLWPRLLAAYPVGLRFGGSGSVAGVPGREEAEQQGNNRDDRAEFHERTVCLSAVLSERGFCLPVRIVAAIVCRDCREHLRVRMAKNRLVREP